MQQDRNDILTQPMGKLFLRMAIPGIIGTVVMGLYNFVDAIFLGQLIGPIAVGAVGLLFTLVIMNQGILVLMGSGSGVVLSVAIAQPVVEFLGGSGDLLAMAVAYLRILVLGMPFMATGAAMNMLLRGEGKMKVAMTIASSSFLLNLVLDPILITWAGIQGAAWATVIAQLAYFLCQMLFHWQGETRLRLMVSNIRVSGALTARVVKAGTPAMLMQIMSVIQMGVLYKVLALSGGAAHIALMTAAMRCYSLVFFIIFGIGYGMQPVVGMNYGAKDYERTKYAWKYFTTVSVAVTFTFWLLFMLFPGLLLSWFISDPELARIGIPYFRMLNIPLLIMGAIPTIMIFFIAVEQPKPAGMLAIVRQVAVFVPLVLILRALMQVEGIWLSLPVTDVLTVLMAFIMIFREFTRLKEGE
ncbi:MAG: hypothetical protein CSA76_06995 [Spirochaetales bacterium]|nr:MAG: hypothetical protein CSA76_06995 [Spirochaetales bacterium]